jgi:hypothetical protein
MYSLTGLEGKKSEFQTMLPGVSNLKFFKKSISTIPISDLIAELRQQPIVS